MDPIILQLAVALGVGLLIGAERERRKGEGPSRRPAGIRTFALAAMSGTLARLEGGAILLAITTAGAVALAAASHLRRRHDDPGLTTEIAFILTVLLGGLAVDRAPLAAGLGVVVAIILAVRSPLHRLIGAVLSEDELRDGLIFAAATFVIWPLLPNRPIGPFSALNLHAVWLVVILVMAIGAIGHAAVRLVGPRLGLPITGLVSGFISSTVTIGAMGARVTRNPQVLAAAVAGAVLSTIATIVQMSVLLFAVDQRVLRVMAAPLICAGLAAVFYATFFVIMALKGAAEPEEKSGRAFSLIGALGFAALLCVILISSAALAHWFGANGVLVGAALTGLVDVHAAAVSTAVLVADGKLPVEGAVLPILAGLSTNTISKALMAVGSGRWPFVARVAPGLACVALAAWMGLLIKGI